MELDLIIAVVFLACAALLFIIAFLILREDPSKRLNRVTGLMFGFAALGPFFYALGSLIGDAIDSRNFIYNLQYVWELFFPQLVFFALCFPTEKPFFSRFPRLKYVIFLPHIFHLALTTFLSDPEALLDLVDPNSMGTLGRTVFEPLEPIFILAGAGFSALLDQHSKLFSTVNFAYVVIAAVILYRSIGRVAAPQLRKQVIIVITGMIVALALYVAAFILPNLGILQLDTAVKVALTVAALLFGCGSIVWAIIRYRFMDVRLIVRQSLVYTLTSALVVGAYLLIIRELSDVIRALFGVDVPGVEIIFIIVALILFQPVMSQIDDLIKKLFIRDKGDYRNISQSFTRKATSVFDPRELFSLTFDVLRGQLLLDGVSICLKSAAESTVWYIDRPDAVERSDNTYEVAQIFLDGMTERRGLTNFEELIAGVEETALLDCLRRKRTRYLVPLVSGEGILGFVAFGDKVSGYRLNYEDITTLSTIADQLAIAVTTSRLYRESIEKQRLEEEMNFARAIQRDLLPKTFPAGEGFHFSAYSESAREVGGDYFDFLSTSSGTHGVVLADVSGKGMPAALLASQIQAAMRSEIRHTDQLSRILANVNEMVVNATSMDKFCTLFFADFDPQTKVLRYSNAGHNYPIVISDENCTNLLDVGGLLLGAFIEATYEQAELKLAPNDVVFIYTDGLNEAVNADDEQYGEQRIVDTLCLNRHLPAAEIQQKVIEDVRSFIGDLPLQDDMTMVVLKVE